MENQPDWSVRDPERFERAVELLMMEQPRERVVMQLLSPSLTESDAQALVEQAWNRTRERRRAEGKLRQMNLKAARAIAVTQIGGAFMLFFVVIQALPVLLGETTFLIKALNAVIFAALGVYCCFMAISGLQLMSGNPGAVSRAIFLWALQIPSVVSPWLTYKLGLGLILVPNLGFQIARNASMGVDFSMGAVADLNLGGGGDHVALGLNVFALGMVSYLARASGFRERTADQFA